MQRSGKILSLEDCQNIVQDFKSLALRWDFNGRINFSGGDPLLYPHFFELLAFMQANTPELKIGILGNPEPLTQKVLYRLNELGVVAYQVSVDGLQKTHDFFRYNGSYKETLSKIQLIKQSGIRSVVMTTVSEINRIEMSALVDILVDNEVDLCGMHRFVPTGSGSKIEKEAFINPLDFRELLYEINDRYKEYERSSTSFGKGEPLWALLSIEDGSLLLQTDQNDNLIWSGCSIGCSGLSILEDGVVLGCRRLPIPIGKVPNQSLKDIFIYSKELEKMREISEIEKCGTCELLRYCRGCRAVAYAVTNNFFGPDPHCWK